MDQESNRRMLASFRLLVNPNDSLAWATLIHLTDDIGDTFVESIYTTARQGRTTFATALLESYSNGFQGINGNVRTAHDLIDRMLTWTTAHPVPQRSDIVGWGQ
jgi:hypothetical protein